MTLSEKDRAVCRKMRRDTDDLMARMRRHDMTRKSKDEQKGLEEYGE